MLVRSNSFNAKMSQLAMHSGTSSVSGRKSRCIVAMKYVDAKNLGHYSVTLILWRISEFCVG